jgi:hypothetical protein
MIDKVTLDTEFYAQVEKTAYTDLEYVTSSVRQFHPVASYLYSSSKKS